MYSKVLFLFIAILVLIAGVDLFAAAPYSASTYITDMSWNWGTHYRNAEESDNWAITWSDDDHQYAVWGDGYGFTESGTKMSLGVSRISGSYPGSGTDLWGTPVTGEGGKSYGIISISGDLYMWYGPGSGVTSYDWQKMKKSTNHGSSWTNASWSFSESTDLVMPTILNFGKDYAGARDGYMYSYFIRLVGNPGSLGVMIPGKIDLARVPTNHIMDQAYYEFYSGMSGDNPTWTTSTDPANREPVFEDSDGVGWNLSCSYNAPLGRYILATEHTSSFNANVGFFEAEEPWGPWKTIEYYTNWGSGSGISDIGDSFYWNFSNKWLSGDGKDFVCVFSGINDMDSYNVVSGSFTVVGGAVAANITAPADDSNEWYGEPVTFTGSASGGTPPYSYSWSSDVDGYLGSGQQIIVSDLSVHKVGSYVEPHTITLTVEDDNTDTNTAQIDFTVFFRGDFEPDGDVDFVDYTVFADEWLYYVGAIDGPTPNSAWWKFDEGGGSYAYDSSVNTNTGTLYNMSDPWVTGKFGNALDFDGSDDYVQVADHSSISFGTGSFSISFWIKKDSFVGDGEILINGSSGGSGETGNRYEITNTNSYGDGDPITPSGAIVFVIDNDAAGNKKVLTSDTTFVTGDWVHCVCIRDASVPQLYIYRNGELDDDKPGHALNVDSSGEPLYIGQDEDGGQRFLGQLDDIRFYNYALIEDDIDDLYNAGPGVADSPANFNGDEIVDYEDLDIMLEDWLEIGY